MEPISLEEFLAEVNNLSGSKHSADYLTVREICAQWDKSERVVRKYLNTAKDLGLLKVVRVTRIALDGKEYKCPAYSFKNVEKKKKSK
jgi:hypothetical protein